MSRLFATDRSATLAFQRVALAAVMLPHGAQKLLGWFGGPGPGAAADYLAAQTHLPWIFGLLAVLAESLGALALLAGAGTRVAALGIVGVMTGAVVSTHLGNGFFMNWFGAKAGEGFEYHLLALALALPLVVRGGGAWSVDRAIDRRIGGGRTRGDGARAAGRPAAAV